MDAVRRLMRIGSRCGTAAVFVWVVSGIVSGADIGPEPVRLWPDGAPGAVGSDEVDQPTIRIYRPSKDATGTAVVICPGGGYAVLATDHEGHQVAKWFSSVGVTGVVLKYRHSPRYRHPTPLSDVQRAIRHVRSHAAALGVSPRRIGVMGFSAGGHLASTVSTHFDGGQSDAGDPVDRVSCRPDFSILAYPVISLTADFAHKGSGRNLLGENPDPELLQNLSNETQVTEQTPPAFLFHTGEDAGVPVQNAIVYYQACLKRRVPAELHVYQFGPHGLGLAPGDPVVGMWKEQLYGWMQTNGFLADVVRAAVKGKVTVDGQPLRWGTITFAPQGDAHAPVASAMVSNGNFSLPAARGVVVGRNAVVIRSLGAVDQRPTIDDVRVISAPGGGLMWDAKPGENDFNVELSGK